MFTMEDLCRYLKDRNKGADGMKIFTVPLVVTTIFSFLSYDELLELHDQFEKFYTRNRYLGDTDILWNEVRRRLVNSKRIAITLDNFSPIEPKYVMDRLNENILVDPFSSHRVTALDLNLSKCCTFFRYKFDFLRLTNLQRLSLYDVAINDVKVIEGNLTALELSCMSEDADIEIIRFMRRCVNLQELVLDYMPHFMGDVPISNSLRYVDLNSGCFHSIVPFLRTHSASLEIIRFSMSMLDVKGILKKMSIDNVQLPKVKNITFTTVDFNLLRSSGYTRLPLNPSMFPALKHLTFGLSRDSKKLQPYHTFCEYQRLYQIIIRPTDKSIYSMKVTPSFLRMLQVMSKGDFTYYYLNVPLTIDFDEFAWLSSSRPNSHNSRLNYWNGQSN